MLHRALRPGDLHPIHDFEVSSLSALQVLALASTDIGKVARRTDDNTFWVLQNNIGPIWKQLVTSEGAGSGTSTSLASIEQQVNRNFKLAVSKKSIEAKIFSYQQLS